MDIYEDGYESGYEDSIRDVLKSVKLFSKIIRRERLEIKGIVYDLNPPADSTEEFKKGFLAARSSMLSKLYDRK